MLKEVGASGQISLGKKYAGHLYDAVFHPDGRVELLPMKLVPATAQAAEEVAKYPVKPTAAGSPKADPAAMQNQQWVAEHAAEIAQYNAWASTREPYAQRVRRWRQSQADQSGSAS